MEYINNPYFLLALTFCIYAIAQIIQVRTHSSLFNPILVTIALIIVFLLFNDISFETYTNENMIEVESLSELKSVQPGEVSELTESWSLCKRPCEIDFKNDSSIENMLSKL